MLAPKPNKYELSTSKTFWIKLNFFQLVKSVRVVFFQQILLWKNNQKCHALALAPIRVTFDASVSQNNDIWALTFLPEKEMKNCFKKSMKNWHFDHENVLKNVAINSKFGFYDIQCFFYLTYLMRNRNIQFTTFKHLLWA